MRRVLLLLVLAAATTAPATAAQPGDGGADRSASPAASHRPSPTASADAVKGGGKARRQRAAKKLRLRTFASCRQLVRYARRNAARSQGVSAGPPPIVPPPRSLPLLRPAPGEGPVPLAVPPAPARGLAPEADEQTSQTNVQEAGVDEPDVVKTADGIIFALAGGKLHAVEAAGPRLLGSLAIEGYGYQLLLHDDRALVIGYESAGGPVPEPGVLRLGPGAQTKTVLTEVDVSDPAAMRVIGTQAVDGTYIDARQSDETARVVISSRPRALADASMARRRGGWIPSSLVKARPAAKAVRRPVAACRQVARPARYSGTGTLSVLTIDLAKGLPAVDVDALMTDGQTVYASPERLYVATPRWLPPVDDPAVPPPDATTTIHSFGASQRGVTEYRASGQVPGHLLNQFSLSEHGGVLRVASTQAPVWWGGDAPDESESFVTVLREQGSALVEIGRVGGLGRGERIYAVRFAGDKGYVVTFRQVDPLYTLDLGEPSQPRVLGELKIMGYSAYLHPIGDDLLIGVGQDANERGTTLGTQISLFDVSDLRRPRRLHQHLVAQSSSDVEHDHHAFLWWPRTKLAVLPVQQYQQSSFTGAIGFHLDRASGIAEAGRASHELPEYYPEPVKRAFVVNGRLFTLSELGLEANDLGTLAEQSWLPFPVEQQPPGPAPLPAPVP